MTGRRFVGEWGHAANEICARLVQNIGCEEAEAGTVVNRALARFSDARVREFIPLLTERDARRQLLA